MGNRLQSHTAGALADSVHGFAAVVLVANYINNAPTATTVLAAVRKGMFLLLASVCCILLLVHSCLH